MKQEKPKSMPGSITIIALIIVALIVAATLFAKNNISKNKKGSDQEINNIVQYNDIINNKKKKTEVENNQAIYSAIIAEYASAIASNNSDTTDYKYVNTTALNHYFNQKDTEYEIQFEYTFYDINGDGRAEMLINNGIIDIFSYDGSNIVRLFNDDANCLAETRCSISLYDNGTIYFKGSGGASNQYVGFYNIDTNTAKLNTLNAYYLKYNANGTVEIYDEKSYDINTDSGEKLAYNNLEDLEKINLTDAEKINLNQLNWIKID